MGSSCGCFGKPPICSYCQNFELKKWMPGLFLNKIVHGGVKKDFKDDNSQQVCQVVFRE